MALLNGSAFYHIVFFKDDVEPLYLHPKLLETPKGFDDFMLQMIACLKQCDGN